MDEDASLEHLNRVLRMMSRCHGELLCADSEDALLLDICRLVVEEGGYKLAWVGYKEHDEAKSVRAAGEWGFDEGYIENARITWADVERGRGPVGIALRTGLPSKINDVHNDPAFAAWREPARQHGFSSALAVPMRHGDDVFGALNVYAADAFAFVPDEIDLLQDLADQLAFGVHAMREHLAREKAETSLREINDSLETAIADRTEHLRQEVEQRRRTQRELERVTEAMKRASAAKSKFLSSVSHELRTPLNAVIGFSQILELDKGHSLSEQQAEAVDQILGNGQALLGMIDAIIELSEADSRSEHVTPHAVDVAQELADCVVSLEMEAEQLGVRLVNEAAGQTFPPIRGDEGKLWRLVHNVLTNAVRYNRRDGTIALSAAVDGPNLHIVVQDTGIGIPEIEVMDVFEPFFRGDNVGDVAGLGVGLSIAKGMCEIIGGDIHLESVEGEGTTVTIELPLADVGSPA